MPIIRYAVLILAMASGDAFAQISKSVSWSSDYWYRGMSLSGGLPVLQGTINYDFRDGWFSGASASSARNSNGTGVSRWVAFGGYSTRLDASTSLDLGGHVSWLADAPSLVFNEIYAGISKEKYSLRLYYSARYLGEKKQTTYLDFNSAYSLGAPWYLALHLGWLEAMSIQDKKFSNRYDARFGIGAYIGFWNCQLLFNTVRSSEPLTVPVSNKVVVNMSYAF
ncbi:hypothetical protein C798_12765 [Herbaspirillum rubrisubalbicans Os34]|uniref:Outer membrane protein beta-barrel domain-containing protein n=2 Tax=Herbaspirillum rubrisubalbicans TaxID=80842 RepID=A0A6M3ZQZ5_9BURK|nr:hypothetical protein C798_12765 [Herbaspirillum rubrisubalbicans Os34]